MFEIRESEGEARGHINAYFDDGEAKIDIGGEPAAVLALIQTVIEEVCDKLGLDFYNVMGAIAEIHTLHHPGTKGDPE